MIVEGQLRLQKPSTHQLRRTSHAKELPEHRVGIPVTLHSDSDMQ